MYAAALISVSYVFTSGVPNFGNLNLFSICEAGDVTLVRITYF